MYGGYVRPILEYADAFERHFQTIKRQWAVSSYCFPSVLLRLAM